VTAHQPLAIVSKLVASDNSHRECMAKQVLERACLAEAGRRSTQANQTPCFTALLWERFGKLGVHQQAFKEVLEGKFIPPNTCNPYVKKVLQHLQKPSGVPEVGPPTLAEYIYGCRHAWEAMSSLYSTIHFGQFMAGTQDMQVANFNAQMTIILAATGYSPNCWHHGLNVMLENAPGNMTVNHSPV